MTTHLSTLCIFCGSRPGTDPAHMASASRFVQEVARRNMGIVYGGGNVGIMGQIANEALSLGVPITGVIPRGLLYDEVAHLGLDALHVVDSMHARKSLMAELSDGFVALPGGFGTLEELFEALTWAQLGIHPKPCAVLNVGGYWQPLIEMVGHMIDQGFLGAGQDALLMSHEDPGALIEMMVDYAPPANTIWRQDLDI